MLLDLRDGIRNSTWLKYVLVGIICVPFALVGINSYFNNGGPDYAAKVNGEKVSLNSFQNAYNQSRSQIQQTFGGQLPAGLDIGSIVNTQAMETVVRQEVLRQATFDNGFAVGDEQLAQQIISIDAFKDEGVFSQDRYTRHLQSAGVSVAEFEEQFRGDLLLQQFRNGVVATGFALSDENQLVSELRNQKRLASLITLDTAAKAETIEVTDEEITAHYDSNLAAFNNPEKVKVEYLELKIDDLKGTIEATDEDIAAYFEQNKTQWVVPEKRDASHILLALDSDASDSDAAEKLAEASAIVARIAAGESLASLAPTLSDDPGSADNGGSLGAFGREVMVPEFEEVAFAMTEGEVSEPVRSDFGFHIIQLNKIIPEQGQSLEEVKDEVEDQYRTELAETRFFEASELLSNASYENSDSLQPAAEETGLTLQSTDWIDRTATEGIGMYPQVISAALTDDVRNNGLNSEILEVAENHAIVLRTIDYLDAAPKPIDEVRDDIIKRVQSEKATEELQALADSLVTELEGGADAEALATDKGGEFTAATAIARTGTDVDRAIVQKLFTMPKPADSSATYATQTDSDSNIVVVAFSGVEAADSEATDASAVAASAMPANAEFQAVVGAIEGEAEIVRNEALLSPEPATY